MEVVQQQEQVTSQTQLTSQSQPIVFDPINQPPLPNLQQPLQGAVFANQDQSFLKWLFSFREESVVPLKNAWRGKEFNYDNLKWEHPVNREPNVIMNEKGITWAITLIESYFSPVFLTTDLNMRTYNFRMREATRIIWNNLTLRYKEFDLKKSDIPRVAEEIESKISAILMGAIGDGYRRFFSTQNQYVETKNLTQNQDQTKPSIFSGISNIFRKDKPQPMQGGY